MEPINQAFSGVIEKAKLRFRIGKKATDVREEAVIQNNVPVIKNDVPSGNVTNNVNPDHIELDIEGGRSEEKKNYVYNNPSKNVIVEKYLDHNEENLDH